MTNRRRLVFDLILLLCIAVALELGTRFLLRGKRFTPDLLYASNTILNSNARLGWSLNPNLIQRIRTPDAEIITYRTNSYGFRGGEPIMPVQVVFAGDSYTFGMDSNTSFPEEFSALTGAHVINTAVVGYGTDQAFLSAKGAMESIGIDPKWIVYGFYQNDVFDNATDLNRYVAGGVIVHKPILDLGTNEYIRADIGSNDVTLEYKERQPLDLLISLALQSRFLWAAQRVEQAFVTKSEPLQITDISKTYLRKNLDNFIDYAAARHARFVLLHIPDKTGQFDKDLGEILQSFCVARNVTYRRPALERSDYLLQDDHLSASGARRVARLLSDDWVASTGDLGTEAQFGDGGH